MSRYQYIRRADEPLREFLDSLFTFQGRVQQRVISSAFVGGRTYYAACEWRKGKVRKVYAMIVETTAHARRGAGTATLGIRPMSEDDGPPQAQCPLSVLDALTATDSPEAQAWREECRAYHRAAAERRLAETRRILRGA